MKKSAARLQTYLDCPSRYERASQYVASLANEKLHFVAFITLMVGSTI